MLERLNGELIQDASLRARIGRAARAYVTTRFSIEAVGEAHLAFFDRMLAHR